MKKIILLLFLTFFLSSTAAFAAGQYDGIWNTPFGFVTVNENNGLIGFQILTPVYEEEVDDYVGMAWSVYVGELKGNAVHLTEVVVIKDTDIKTMDVIFDSDTTMRAVIRSCEPVELCHDIFSLLNQEFSGEKFW